MIKKCTHMDWINEDRDRENFSAMEIYRVLSRLYSSDCNSIAYYVLKKKSLKNKSAQFQSVQIPDCNINLFLYIFLKIIC